MIAFFDTNIYIDYLKGIFPEKTYKRHFEEYIIRICPVVYQELIRGIRSEPLKKRIDQAVEKVFFLPPPTNKMWIQAGELAGKVIGSYDDRSLAKIQNDLLIALTASQNGATLITQDLTFKIIQREIPFRLVIHP